MAQAFEQWYRREHPRLLGLVTVQAGDPVLAEDVTAEAFARALERWDRVGVMAEPVGWVYRVAVNVLRRRQRRAALERRLLRRRQPSAPTPAGLDPAVWKAVRGLPPRQREALALRYVADLTEAQVAERMGVAEGTVSATLHQARRAVERRLTTPTEARDA